MTLLEVAPAQTLRMRTRDGVELVSDVWSPAEGGPYPVLLMRQAYGRRIGTSLCYAPPNWYAARGFIVVMQDVRGRGESGGRFALFDHEARDGADTVRWAASLPNSNGRVGMFGFSFQGTNQLLALSEPLPELRAVAPAMIGWDLRTDWAYENGAFPLRANLGWATQLMAETARLRGDHAAQAELFAASRALPFNGRKPGRPDYMERLGHHGHYADWAARPDEDDAWRAVSPAAHAEAIVSNRPAVMLIGGWYDSHLPGTLAAWHALQGRVPARLVVGPWAHFPWDRRVGERDFGASAITDIDQQQINWFDRWLRDAPSAWHDDTPVRLFDMGACCWRDLPALPDETGASRWFPSGSGRTAIDMRNGGLAPDPSAASVETLVHDPWRPPAPVGGSFGQPPGPIDRHAVDQRADVLCFSSAPCVSPLLLCGSVTLQLAVHSDAASFDLHGALSVVDASGRSHAVAEGYGSFADGLCRLPMRATCFTLQPGQHLRLSVAAACFPAFPVNPGSGARPWDAALEDLRVITLTIRTGADSGTALLLPMLPHPDTTENQP